MKTQSSDSQQGHSQIKYLLQSGGREQTAEPPPVSAQEACWENRTEQNMNGKLQKNKQENGKLSRRENRRASLNLTR